MNLVKFGSHAPGALTNFTARNFSKRWGPRPISTRKVNSRVSLPAVGRFAPFFLLS